MRKTSTIEKALMAERANAHHHCCDEAGHLIAFAGEALYSGKSERKKMEAQRAALWDLWQMGHLKVELDAPDQSGRFDLLRIRAERLLRRLPAWRGVGEGWDGPPFFIVALHRETKEPYLLRLAFREGEVEPNAPPEPMNSGIFERGVFYYRLTPGKGLKGHDRGGFWMNRLDYQAAAKALRVWLATADEAWPGSAFRAEP